MPENKAGSAATGSPDLKITPPFGYDEVVPLQKQDCVLLPRGATPKFCRSINAIAISFSEFTQAARDYPIVFASGDGAQTFAPVAVLGLADKQNVFINAAGDWEPSAYVPAFVRRYPFCISKLYVDGKPRSERMVCVAKAHLDRQGIALFDAEGKATARWEPIERLLQDYENDLDLTAQMCATFAKLGLFSPFQFQVMQGETPTLTLQGMFRLDEGKLANLKPASLKALLSKGLMGKAYAHFHSLENFARLYNRALARAQSTQLTDSRG